jgi:4-carboxymuconolactone decarboxylase
MSRIPLKTIEQAPEADRDFMVRRGNLNVFHLLANAPRVFGGWTRMTDDLLDSPTFSLRMRELVILRVAYLQRSPYEIAQHVDVARRAGIADREIEALADSDLQGAGFDATELAVLTLVTELCTTKHLTDNTFTAVETILGPNATTELLMIVSLYFGLALVLNAADLEIDSNSRLQV